ncbi:hypothetical protein ACH41H_40375 [Streptomyces sp. NPDC020800]|uniref:hypothetical protein n=1 Tax=Streptomyces sp. NPDC020800 TaxID=3365092 RepID=UPI0037AC09D5
MSTLDATLEMVVHAISLACPSGTSRTYELRPIDPTDPLPSFEAGAHIDVHVGPSLIRQTRSSTPLMITVET